MKFKKTQVENPEIDMTPMIDIVFQLIAFFTIVSNFDQTKADERVKLPRDPMAKPPEVKRENELYINLGYVRNKSGEIVGSRSQPYVFYQGGDKEKYTVVEFKPILHQEARLYGQEGTDPKTVTVVLRADKEVPTGLVQEMIKFSQEASFERFALMATQKTD